MYSKQELLKYCGKVALCDTSSGAAALAGFHQGITELGFCGSGMVNVPGGVHAWLQVTADCRIDPSDIVFCRGADGGLVVLGSGAYGQASAASRCAVLCCAGQSTRSVPWGPWPGKWLPLAWARKLQCVQRRELLCGTSSA